MTKDCDASRSSLGIPFSILDILTALTPALSQRGEGAWLLKHIPRQLGDAEFACPVGHLSFRCRRLVRS